VAAVSRLVCRLQVKLARSREGQIYDDVEAELRLLHAIAKGRIDSLSGPGGVSDDKQLSAAAAAEEEDGDGDPGEPENLADEYDFGDEDEKLGPLGAAKQAADAKKVRRGAVSPALPLCLLVPLWSGPFYYPRNLLASKLPPNRVMLFWRRCQAAAAEAERATRRRQLAKGGSLNVVKMLGTGLYHDLRRCV